MDVLVTMNQLNILPIVASSYTSFFFLTSTLAGLSMRRCSFSVNVRVFDSSLKRSLSVDHIPVCVTAATSVMSTRENDSK